MITLRHMKKPTLYVWAFLLSVALLCAQSVKLHVHNFVDHDQQDNHITTELVTPHSHLSELHLSVDVSHIDHHDEVLLELDASPDGLLKKLGNNILTLALLASLFSLLLVGFYQQILRRYRDNEAIIPWRYHFSPPLRAPPH